MGRGRFYISWKSVAGGLSLTSLASVTALFYYFNEARARQREATEAEQNSQENLIRGSIAKIRAGWHDPDVASWFADNKTIERAEVKELIKLREEPKQAKYLILIGEKGIGKTTLMRQAFHGKSGTIYVSFSSTDDPKDVLPKFYEAIGFPTDQVKGDQLVFFKRLCALAAEKREDGSVQRPVIVVEVESRETPDGLVTNLCGIIKRLACDFRVARGVVVLSDALAAMHLSPDPTRRRQLWLRGLTKQEATILLGNEIDTKIISEAQGNDQDIARLDEDRPKYLTAVKEMIFTTIGTHPGQLMDLLQSSNTIKGFIESTVEQAGIRINRSLSQNPNWANVYDALLKKAPPEDFLAEKEVLDIMATPMGQVLDGVKEFHVLSYDLERSVFYFHSPAVRTAATRNTDARTRG